MVIVFNIKGAAIGILGLFLAALAILATGFVTAGLFTLAIVWCAFGRRGNSAEAPSIMYIPLCYWGILAGALVFPAFPVDVANNKTEKEQSPYALAFEQDEEGLATNETDAPDLSDAVTRLFNSIMPDEQVNVRVKSSEDAVLILVQVDNLKEIPLPDRQQLVRAIADLAETKRPGVKVYTGIKGRFAYGAVSTPRGQEDIGKVVLESPLLAFYQELPTAPADDESVDETQMVSTESSDDESEVAENSH